MIPTDSKAMRELYSHFLLTPDDVNKILHAHRAVEVPRGEILLNEGEISEAYYVLEGGLARAFVEGLDGREITTEFFCEKEIVIVPTSLFHRIPSQETLQTVTDCVLWKIDYETFQTLFEEMEGLREWGRAWFSYQVFAMKQRSLDLVVESASARYLKLLSEKPQVIQYAPLKQIASYLGITDTSLSRIIRKEILQKKE